MDPLASGALIVETSRDAKNLRWKGRWVTLIIFDLLIFPTCSNYLTIFCPSTFFQLGNLQRQSGQICYWTRDDRVDPSCCFQLNIFDHGSRRHRCGGIAIDIMIKRKLNLHTTPDVCTARMRAAWFPILHSCRVCVPFLLWQCNKQIPTQKQI